MNVIILVIMTALLRLAEVAYGEANAHAMLKNGGKEFSPRQRLPVFALYALWLAALAVLVPPGQQAGPLFLALFFAAQCLRWWAIAYLKGYWTTRIVVMPLAWKVTGGPYKFLKHPIYIALISEIMALSLCFNQVMLACVSGALMVLWLRFRIRAENRALQMML